MGFTYIIEHMEDDEETSKAIPPWVELEYSHMRTLAGPDSHVRFTHLSSTSCNSLNTAFNNTSPTSTSSASNDGPKESSKLARFTCHQAGILDILKELDIPLEKVCLLDPKAEKGLSPEDGDGRFSAFLFGGILGDDPPRDRTSELRVMGFPNRHLDTVQMTTDTALGVTKIVAQDGVPLDKIPYVDFPTIRFSAKESVEMPFRYIADEKKEPILPPGMRQLLREDLNKSFDF